MTLLKKTLVAAIGALTLASGSVATSSPAAAWGRYGWGGPGIGLLGGLAAGAIIGNALRPAYGYAPAYAYEPEPVYNPCYRGQTPVYDAYGNFVGMRSARICN